MKQVFESFLFCVLIAGVNLMESMAESLPDKGGVTKYSLENGMTVLLERNASSQVVAVNVWVKTGSACETEGEHGLAHVHEHMLFKGTEKRSVGEIAKLVEAGGGDINAFTSFDETVYYVVSARRFLPTALDVLSDVMENSAFDPGELEKELEVVLEEIRRGEDSPRRVLSQKLFSTAYEVHPYGRPVIGTARSVGGFTREKILEFYRKWYSPDNMILVVVGDFDPGAITQQIESTFGKIARRKTPACDLPAEPDQAATRTFALGRDVSTGYFGFAFHIPSAGHSDTPVLDVVGNILGSGESSRLYRRLKEEKGTVSDIYAYAYTPMHDGLFVVGGTLRPEKIKDASGRILAELELLKGEPVSERELSKAKISIESDYVRSRETMQGQARNLGYLEVEVGDHGYEAEYLDRVKGVSREDVIRIAKKYFTQNNLTAGVVVPQGEEREAASALSASAVFAAPKEPEVEKSPAENTEFARYELSNGIRVLVKENRSVPLFSAQAAFLGGLRYEDEDTNGISNFMAEMFTRGTENRSAEDIAEEIEGLGGDIGGFSGKNSVGVSLSAFGKNFAAAMDIFSDVILNPSFSSLEMERGRREILAALEKQEDNLARKTVRNFLGTLFRDHPYRFDVLGTRENVSGFTSADILGFYEKVVRPENMVISVVGDVDTEHALKELEKLFGSMEKGGFKKTDPDPEPPLSVSRRDVRYEKDKAQTHIITGFHAPGLGSDDRPAFEVLNSVLSGQGGRLFIELRDKKSLAYSVTSFYVPGIEGGYFGVYIGTAPHKEKQALSEMRKQLELVLQGVGEDEVDRAKNYIVGSFEVGLQKNSAQASVAVFDELYGMGFQEHKRFPEKILAVTADDVVRVAKKYINTKVSATAVVKPEGNGR